MDKVLEERLATITEHLVSFPTVDGNSHDIYNCLEWVRTRVLTQSPRLDVRSFNSHDKPSLLFTAGKVPPKVLFCGHLDVVDAPKKEFHASLVDSTRIRGRGTADMKGPIAALLDIMATEPISGVGLLLTTDEEVGGENGTNHVLQNLGWKPEVAVLPDGGANMRLVVEQKGILRLRITAKGVAALSSRPWLGDNPFMRIYHAHDALLRAYPMPKGEDDWRISIALTEMYGAVAPNSVPWLAEATLDIRYPDLGEEPFERMLADIRRRLARYDIIAHIASKSPGFHLETGLPVLERLQDVAGYLHHDKLPLVREAGASDARYFASMNVPVLMFQPECANWHQPNEWISLESLALFRNICLYFMRSMLDKDYTPYSSIHHKYDIPLSAGSLTVTITEPAISSEPSLNLPETEFFDAAFSKMTSTPIENEITMWPEKRAFSTGSTVHILSPKQWALFNHLLEKEGQICTREELISILANETKDITESALAMNLSRLRKELESDSNNPYLLTAVHKQGYRLIRKVINSRLHVG